MHASLGVTDSIRGVLQGDEVKNRIRFLTNGADGIRKNGKAMAANQDILKELAELRRVVEELKG
jgi:hypothetical protein